MKPNVGRGQWVALRLGVLCIGLLSLSALSAQEPKLRVTLNTGLVSAVAFRPDGKELALGGEY